MVDRIMHRARVESRADDNFDTAQARWIRYALYYIWFVVTPRLSKLTASICRSVRMRHCIIPSAAGFARIATFREQGEPTMSWLRDSRVPIIELDCSGTPDHVWSQARPARIACARACHGAAHSTKPRPRS